MTKKSRLLLCVQWTAAGLAGLFCASFSAMPSASVAQPAHPKPGVQKQMTAIERQRACSVADEAWPAIVGTISNDWEAPTAFTPAKVAIHKLDDPGGVGGPDKWNEFRGSWKFIWRRPIFDSRPPTATLYQQWRRVSESSIFECADFAARHSIQAKEPVDHAPRGTWGHHYDAIYVGVSLPVVSPDGRTALIYVKFYENLGNHGVLTHLAKVEGGWRVVGERLIDAGTI